MSSQPELEYKRLLLERLRARGWHCQEHEDRQELFIPDLSIARVGIDAWVEVKYRDKLPPTLNSMKHWTKGQEDWLVNRGRTGSGHCYMLLGVPGHHYLWWYGSFSIVRNLPIDEAVERCYGNVAGSLDTFACWLGNTIAPRGRRSL